MYVPGPFELWVIQVVGLIYNHLKGKYIKTWIREQEQHSDLWVHKNCTSDVIKKIQKSTKWRWNIRVIREFAKQYSVKKKCFIVKVRIHSLFWKLEFDNLYIHLTASFGCTLAFVQCFVLTEGCMHFFHMPVVKNLISVKCFFLSWVYIICNMRMSIGR